MPNETPPPKTWHGVSGCHPNTHTNPTHACLVHAVSVGQEGPKATDSL